MMRRLDVVELLHLLGHELRSPTGVLLGYLRMLQEGRFGSEADRQRILDNMRGPLARMAGLSDEVARLARWLAPSDRTPALVDARELIERGVGSAGALLGRPIDAEIDIAPGAARVSVLERDALEAALGVVIQATAREAGDAAVVARATVRRDQAPAVELMAGPLTLLPAPELTLSPDEPDVFSVTRGGMGLSLVLAVVVLDAHAARVWNVAGTASVAGVRLPVAAEEPQ